MDRIFTVGVVAVQGAFEEHCSALGKLGVSVKEIRSVSDLSQNIDGLIFPEEKKAPLRENFFGIRTFRYDPANDKGRLLFMVRAPGWFS